MGDAPKIRGIVLLAGSQAILDSLKKAFAKTDYALLHARTGKQAITLLARLKAEIDPAIIDLDLEDVNGLEVVGLLTAPGRKPSKIIVSTSRHHEPLLKQVAHLGIDHAKATCTGRISGNNQDAVERSAGSKPCRCCVTRCRESARNRSRSGFRLAASISD